MSNSTAQNYIPPKSTTNTVVQLPHRQNGQAATVPAEGNLTPQPVTLEALQRLESQENQDSMAQLAAGSFEDVAQNPVVDLNKLREKAEREKAEQMAVRQPQVAPAVAEMPAIDSFEAVKPVVVEEDDDESVAALKDTSAAPIYDAMREEKPAEEEPLIFGRDHEMSDEHPGNKEYSEKFWKQEAENAQGVVEPGQEDEEVAKELEGIYKSEARVEVLASQQQAAALRSGNIQPPTEVGESHDGALASVVKIVDIRAFKEAGAADRIFKHRYNLMNEEDGLEATG